MTKLQKIPVFLVVAVAIALLVTLTPTMVGADGGVQSFPATPYKLLMVRSGLGGSEYWWEMPTGRWATDVFVNPETRTVYWINTDGQRRIFVAPAKCSVWLEWRELEFSRQFLWFGSYEEVSRRSLVLGPVTR